jgi:hypothetical protein
MNLTFEQAGALLITVISIVLVLSLPVIGVIAAKVIDMRNHIGGVERTSTDDRK